MGRGLGSGGEKGLTVQGLRKAGYEAIFVGIGLPDSKVAPIFEGLRVDNGFYTFKDFLPVVSMESKSGECWEGRLPGVYHVECKTNTTITCHIWIGGFLAHRILYIYILNFVTFNLINDLLLP